MVRTAEFGGFEAVPWVRIDGNVFCLGEELRGRYGFVAGVTLDDRLFRILLALAIARKLDPRGEGGWRTAAQLAVGGERLRSTESTERFLWLRLRGYTARPEEELRLKQPPETHLIQYAPQRVQKRLLRGGRSRGPYRLGPTPTLDVAAALKFLGYVSARLTTERIFELPLPDVIERLVEVADHADYHTARAVALTALHVAPPPAKGRVSRDLTAQVYHRLGEFDVQLSLSSEAIHCVRRARQLYRRQPLHVASTFVAESLAESQRGDVHAAFRAAQRACDVLDNVAPLRRRWQQTECYGVLGMQVARLRNPRSADRYLRRAFEIAQDVSDPRRTCRWTVRRAENFILQRDFHMAERALGLAHDLQNKYTIAGLEPRLVWETTAKFLVATGQPNQAEPWLRQAREFTRSRGLRDDSEPAV